MKFGVFIPTLVLAFAGLIAQEPNQTVTNQPGGTTPTGAPVNANPQSAAIRILTPVAGQTLSSDFVDVRFEVVQPNPTDQNNFYVQLDGRDPVTLTTTEYTFKGLRPGPHSVVVTEVDANGTPVQGSRATVQFNVGQPQGAQPAGGSTGNTGASSQPRDMSSVLDKAAADPNAAKVMLAATEREQSGGTQDGLPATGSSLPILSLVGFGVLVCGAVGAIRRARAR
ncbi:MAG TPA: hypothetical protein VMT82_01505 [candidate division Zixibacteria bacterium]|nr:hypothetical protein [candidate division Zixibacteria bacterium]